MAWQLRLTDIHPNGLDQVVFICDVYDDTIIDEDTKAPVVQYTIAPSFPNSAGAGMLKQVANDLGKQVQAQKSAIDALKAQVAPGTVIPIQ